MVQKADIVVEKADVVVRKADLVVRKAIDHSNRSLAPYNAEQQRAC